MTRPTVYYYDADFEAMFNNAIELLAQKDPAAWTTVERALDAAAECVRPWRKSHD